MITFSNLALLNKLHNRLKSSDYKFDSAFDLALASVKKYRAVGGEILIQPKKVTKADLLQVKQGKWYQYVNTEQIRFESNSSVFVLNQWDYFCLGDNVGPNITIYKQGLPKQAAFITIDAAAALLRIGRPVHVRESKFRGYYRGQI
jgi:hypothetical protein